MTCGRKMLRQMWWPTYDDDWWSMQLNQEICSALKSPGITTIDKVYRLEWDLYVISMDGERTVKYWKPIQEEGGKKGIRSLMEG